LCEINPSAGANSHKLAEILFQLVFPFEAFDAPRRIDEFLLSRKERMASGANFDLDRFHRRTGLKRVSAGARDGRQEIVWMDALFHE